MRDALLTKQIELPEYTHIGKTPNSYKGETFGKEYEK